MPYVVCLWRRFLSKAQAKRYNGSFHYFISQEAENDASHGLFTKAATDVYPIILRCRKCLAIKSRSTVWTRAYPWTLRRAPCRHVDRSSNTSSFRDSRTPPPSPSTTDRYRSSGYAFSFNLSVSTSTLLHYSVGVSVASVSSCKEFCQSGILKPRGVKWWSWVLHHLVCLFVYLSLPTSITFTSACRVQPQWAQSA